MFSSPCTYVTWFSTCHIFIRPLLSCDGNCHDLGSSYGNQRTLPVDFPVPPFFISPFTSYFLLQRSTFPFARVHPRRPFRSLTSAPSTPTIIADRFRSRNFLSSSFSVLPPTLPSFYRRIQSGMGSPQPRSTSSLHSDDDVPRRVLTRESMPPTTLRHVFQMRPRLKSARGYIRRINYSASGKSFITGRHSFIVNLLRRCTVHSSHCKE